MAVHAGQVSVSTTPTLVYETPDGVETCLVIRANTTNTVIGGSDLASFADGYPFEQVNSTGSNAAPFQVTLTGFTGAVYAMTFSGSDTVNYIAADIQ